MAFALHRSSNLPELKATIPQIHITSLLYGVPPAQIVMYQVLHPQLPAKYPLALAQLNPSRTLYIA